MGVDGVRARVEHERSGVVDVRFSGEPSNGVHLWLELIKLGVRVVLIAGRGVVSLCDPGQGVRQQVFVAVTHGNGPD